MYERNKTKSSDPKLSESNTTDSYCDQRNYHLYYYGVDWLMTFAYEPMVLQIKNSTVINCD